MRKAGAHAAPILPVAHTLRWVVVNFRLLGWIWLLFLVSVVLVRGDPGDRGVIAAASILATAWTGVTLGVARDPRLLGDALFVVLERSGGVRALSRRTPGPGGRDRSLARPFPVIATLELP